jgi:hypothetical protein
MKKSNRFKNLVKDLNRDPRLRRVTVKTNDHSHRNGRAKVQKISDFFLLGLAVVSRFASKKRARTIDEFMDIIYLLVQTSLLLKENIFDRPEVKEFIGQQSEKVHFLAQKYVALILSKTKWDKASKLRKKKNTSVILNTRQRSRPTRRARVG